MRTALHALTDELKRLKATGVKRVTVSDEAVAALRAAIKKTAAPDKAPVAVKPLTPLPAPSPALAPAPSLSVPKKTVASEPRQETAEPTPASPTSTIPPPPVVRLPSGDKRERWDALYQLVLNDPVCRENVRPGKKIVLGVGTLDAKIFFCGEAPGAEEEVQGEPFVGPAGQLLTKMILAMGLKRSDVYIGNIMNWRPQLPLSAGGVQFGNRPPTPEEMSYCLPYLRAQLEIVDPELIVALGSTAAQGLLGAGSFKALGEIRGQWKLFAGKPVMVTYHPSYILRNQSNRSKRAIWEDLLKVMERAALPISAKQREYFLDK